MAEGPDRRRDTGGIDHEHNEAIHVSEEEMVARYVTMLEAQRKEKDDYFRDMPYSPILPEERDNFEGLHYFKPNLDYQYVLSLQTEEPEQLVFQTSTGDEQVYLRVGVVQFDVDGEPAQLAIYRSLDSGELFLPFRDATSGQESYGAGRYLEPVELEEDELLIDFNLAYNPFCAYAPHYSCPLPPIENWLKVPIRAGEKQYKEEPE